MLETDIETLEDLRSRYPDTPWPQMALSDTERLVGIIKLRKGEYGFVIKGDGLIVPYSSTGSTDNFLAWGLLGSMPKMCIFSNKPFELDDAAGLQTSVDYSQAVIQSFHSIATARKIINRQLIPFATLVRMLVGSPLNLGELFKQIGILIDQLETSAKKVEPEKALSSVQSLRKLGVTRFNEGFGGGFDLTPDFVEQICTECLQQAV